MENINSYNMLAIVIAVTIIAVCLMASYIAQKYLFTKHKGKVKHASNKYDSK
ncbi:MAG: hypothetical protein ACOYVK_08745 [Bacillota bacterium]